MHAAQVQAWGKAPKWVEVPELSSPTESQIRLKVLAVGIHNVVKSMAAGRPGFGYGRPLPVGVGMDGVGLDETTGRRYYYSTMLDGAMADYVNVDRFRAYELHEDADPVSVAALVNPAVSSWMALKGRAGVAGTSLPNGFSALIIGATSMSGRFAAHVARHLGAGRIIGTGRNQASLEGVDELDERIAVSGDPTAEDFAKLGHVDVVLDYVSGKYPEAVVTALKPQREVTYIQIGFVSGDSEFHLPTALLRMKPISIRGAGPGSWNPAEMGKETKPLLEALGRLRTDNVFVAKMSDVETAWDDSKIGSKRLVFTP